MALTITGDGFPVLIVDRHLPERMRAITRLLIVHEKESSDSNNEHRYRRLKELLGDIMADRLIPDNGDRIFWNPVNSRAKESGKIDVIGIRPGSALPPRRQEVRIEEQGFGRSR